LTHKPANKPVEKTVFSLAVLSVLIVSVPLIIFNETIGPKIIELYDFVAFNLGIVYQWVAIGCMGLWPGSPSGATAR
jgi:hypothetical protein